MAATIGRAQQLEYMGEVLLQNVFGESTKFAFPGPCPSYQNPPVHALQLRMARGRANIEYFAVKFGNGENQQFQVRNIFEPNSTSRVLDLNGNDRCVNQVVVIGNSLNPSPAIVQIWGYRSGYTPPGSSDWGQPRLIGSTNLMLQHDADDIFLRCPSPGNSFAAVQVGVRGNNAQINRIVLTFGNGERQALSLRPYFAQGSYSEIKDLRQNRRCIQRIHVEGRTVDQSGGIPRQALVQIFGY